MMLPSFRLPMSSNTSERERELLERISAQEDMLRTTMDYMSEIQQQLELQKEALERKNREILDSVNYAKLIQDAIMPNQTDIEQAGLGYFTLHRQRDIIGGDFPYARRSHNELYFAAIDCVGHGIPGAMLTSMVHYALNEVLLRNGIERLEQVPSVAFRLLVQNLHSAGSRSVGFDMALFRFNVESGRLQFCGAGRPLYVISKGQIEVYKGSRFGMNMDHTVELTSQDVRVSKGDRVFLFSDGFTDQFGGPDDRKFSSAGLRKLLCSTSQLNLKKQKEVLNDVLMDWRNGGEQTDDVLIMGIQI